MNLSDLKSKLGVQELSISRGQITLDKNTLSKNLNDVLKYCYDNQPLVIDNASVKSEDEEAGRLTISGKSAFLEMSHLDVTAEYYIDDAGNAQFCVHYELIGEAPGANPWKFSRSFPKLPAINDDSQPIVFDRLNHTLNRQHIVPLDQLILFNARFVVSSEERKDPVTDCDLAWGINFISNVKPQGPLAILEQLFNCKDPLVIYGTIRKAIQGESATQLASQYPVTLAGRVYVWDIVDRFEFGLPGILLKSDLGIDYSIAKDKGNFAAKQLIFYTPYSDEWQLPDTKPAFVPTQAYTGNLSLAAADIEVDVVAPVNYGHDELTLLTNFEGVKLDNLAKLTGLTGSSEDPLVSLPKEIRSLGNKLGELELINATLCIDYTFFPDVPLTYVAFTVGIPELNWNVWKEHISIDSITTRFEIDYPLNNTTDPIGSVARIPVSGRMGYTRWGFLGTRGSTDE